MNLEKALDPQARKMERWAEFEKQLNVAAPTFAPASFSAQRQTEKPLSKGDEVIVRKRGLYEGRTAVVEDPRWNGMVRVKLDGATKCYLSEELETFAPASFSAQRHTEKPLSKGDEVIVRKPGQEAKKKAEEEAKKKAEEEATEKERQEAKEKAEEEAKEKAEEGAKEKAEQKAKKKAGTETQLARPPRLNEVNVSGKVPLPEGCDTHFFLSHFQEVSEIIHFPLIIILCLQFQTGSDQVSTLELELAGMGFVSWYDNKSRDLTKAGMEAGVAKTGAFVLFLSKGVMARYGKE
jgi:hypothetical protein